MGGEQLSDTDIVVVGGGPAGVAAAVSCFQAGLRTVLLTSSASQDVSPAEDEVLLSSESLHPGLEPLLRQLSAELVVRQSSRGTYRGIRTGASYTPLGSDASGEWSGHHVDRRRFDAALMASARRAGVPILGKENVVGLLREGQRVVGVRRAHGGTVRAACVIDGTGRRNMSAREMGFQARYFSEPLTAWSGVVEGADASYLPAEGAGFLPRADGWTWLAPEDSQRCSWTRLARTAMGNPGLPAELRDGSPLGRVRATNVRWRLIRPLACEGLLLAGDAAGVLDPAAGQGVLTALWSGLVAARTAVQCVRQPGLTALLLAQYDGWFVDQYLGRARRLQQYYAELGVGLQVDASGL